MKDKMERRHGGQDYVETGQRLEGRGPQAKKHQSHRDLEEGGTDTSRHLPPLEFGLPASRAVRE